ncbi:MAG: thiamine pyrophosphate-binding protein [Nitrospiraceae bacterium]|nr:thiamine pyrophosphate-binding protein [Nitrospiraceae bacterium]
MTSAELIIKCLENHGVEYIFGVPGGALVGLNNALYKSAMNVIVTKHEQGAAFIADGYARVSGNVGVCFGTSGPGATNLMTGVASAYADSIPLVVLTGQVATTVFGKGATQEFENESLCVVDMFRKITKYSDVLLCDKKANDMVSRALRSALSGRPGPVHLNMPSDIMKHEIEEKYEHINNINKTMVFDRDGVKSAAQLLLKSKNPAIIAGWGTTLSKAHQELLEIAELMDIPVATTPKGKGIFNEHHPLSLGVFGLAGSPVAKEYMTENVDLMIAVGTSFNEEATLGWNEELCSHKEIIQIDIDPDEIGKNYEVTVGIPGDAKIVLRELIYELKRNLNGSLGHNGRSKQKQIAELKELLKENEWLKENNSDIYKPQELIEDIVRFFPEDSIYFVEIGNAMTWAIHHMKIKIPYSFYVSLGFGSMGYATAAAIGGKLAAPDKPVISIAGDGAFQMNGMEIATAVNYDIPVIWVVMNNAMLGTVHYGWKLLSCNEGIPSRFKRVDFAKIAEGLGARGMRIEKPCELNKELIDDIISSKKPTVLDVIIDEKEIPPIHGRIETLKKHYK